MKRIALVSLLALLLLPIRPARAQTRASFGSSELENRFPDGLTFQVVVQGDGAEIVAGRLYYALRNATSTAQVVLDVQPGKQVTLRHTWDTSKTTVPPGAPVFFHWEVTDSQGQRFSSAEELFFYNDVRFDWQVLEDENIAIWTHDRPAAFGEQVFDIAQRAFTRQHDLFQAELAYQIRIIIYNDSAEFAGWHTYVSEFIGGQAFTGLGLTTQIVPLTGPQKSWLNDVIPHELAHLYFDQVTRHPLSMPPLWLNEGVAQYNEFRDLGEDLRWAKLEILNGNLIPLRTIVGSFGNQEGAVRLAYAESVSAVSYMIESYGAQGLADLLAAFGSGRPVEGAFVQALGRTPAEFEADWLAWLGVPGGNVRGAHALADPRAASLAHSTAYPAGRANDSRPRR